MSTDSTDLTPVERKFLEAVRHHLAGWKSKIENDFSEASYSKEIQNLAGDPVYEKFGFAIPEYVLVRLMGRISISIGRRLGEIYDKNPRFVASARFDIPPEKVAEKFNGLELDIGLRKQLLPKEDQQHVANAIKRHCNVDTDKGLGIEIRYNFNPNDSARIRKDVDMAGYLSQAGLFPLYLVYSSISPRDDAIGRLKRAGWYFLQGTDASNFTTDLFGADFLGILDRPQVQQQVRADVQDMMTSIFHSYAFSQVSLSNTANRDTWN